MSEVFHIPEGLFFGFIYNIKYCRKNWNSICLLKIIVSVDGTILREKISFRNIKNLHCHQLDPGPPHLFTSTNVFRSSFIHLVTEVKGKKMFFNVILSTSIPVIQANLIFHL